MFVCRFYGARSLKVALNHHLVARTHSCKGDFRSALQSEKEAYAIYKQLVCHVLYIVYYLVLLCVMCKQLVCHVLYIVYYLILLYIVFWSSIWLSVR